MDDNTNYTQLELETIFANDFKTSKFILLAQFYFNTHDFERAAKVCEIGLENHGNNLEARFMLAKIYLLNNQITKAEKFLNTSLDQQLISNTMLKLLIEIRDSLNRSINETKKIVDILLKSQSDDPFANRWIHQYYDNQKNKASAIPKQDLTFKINPNIISFTFYNVLKKQKYYHQAITVLDMLQSSKKINSKVYKQEHQSISKFLN
tara:strand:+ start:3677 stop:4297 length:621 start_codon:yes stop_codon:yes gene_type:complete